MSRRKPYRDEGEPVEAATEIEEVELEEIVPEPEQEAPAPVSGDVLLKNHTHAGVMYEAGTPVADLNASSVLLEKLKNLGVV